MSEAFHLRKAKRWHFAVQSVETNKQVKITHLTCEKSTNTVPVFQEKSRLYSDEEQNIESTILSN